MYFYVIVCPEDVHYLLRNFVTPVLMRQDRGYKPGDSISHTESMVLILCDPSYVSILHSTVNISMLVFNTSKNYLRYIDHGGMVFFVFFWAKKFLDEKMTNFFSERPM